MLAAVDDEERDDRAEERLDGDAGEQERGDGRPTAFGGDGVHEERGDDRTDERGRLDADDRRDAEKSGDDGDSARGGDGGDRAEGGPGGHADDARVRHRIPEEPLHDGAGGGEREPDDRREHDPGCT